jgi:hypothetical protein
MELQGMGERSKAILAEARRRHLVTEAPTNLVVDVVFSPDVDRFPTSVNIGCIEATTALSCLLFLVTCRERQLVDVRRCIARAPCGLLEVRGAHPPFGNRTLLGRHYSSIVALRQRVRI